MKITLLNFSPGIWRSRRTYHRKWLLSACAYNTWQQENMHLTGSMHLIKSAKRGRRGMRKERAEGRKAYNSGQEAIRKRNSQYFSSPAYL